MTDLLVLSLSAVVVMTDLLVLSLSAVVVCLLSPPRVLFSPAVAGTLALLPVPAGAGREVLLLEGAGVKELNNSTRGKEQGAYLAAAPPALPTTLRPLPTDLLLLFTRFDTGSAPERQRQSDVVLYTCQAGVIYSVDLS